VNPDRREIGARPQSSDMQADRYPGISRVAASLKSKSFIIDGGRSVQSGRYRDLR